MFRYLPRFNTFSKSMTNQERVLYSCVVDDDPKYYLQGYYFVLALVHLAKVSGRRIFIHMTARNANFERIISEYNVNIVYVEPWGDKKYCNKLSQLDTPALLKADYVFLCDADICIVEDIALLMPMDRVSGKTVDTANPSLERLNKIYEFLNVSIPDITTDTLNEMPTFVGNFNGGLYGIPRRFLKKLGGKWRSYAAEILKRQDCRELLKEKIIHADQIAFSLALNDLKVPYKLLSYDMNFPTHVRNLDALKDKIDRAPSVIHYHSNLTATGLLADIDIDLASPVIANINRVIAKHYNNEIFWNYRYKYNPTLGSGVGSRGSIAEYKFKLLKIIGIEQESSVLDIGCGDLEIIRRFSLRKYAGVDISIEALTQAKEKFPQFDFYSLVTENGVIPSASLTICLDVAIHQSSEADYQLLLDFVVEKTDKTLIVSGYDAQVDNSNMCFFYEPLKASLSARNKFKFVFKISEYRGLSVYIADTGGLSKIEGVPNDISNDDVLEYIERYKINKDLLLSAVYVSRSAFGWFTKHKPRLIEYPWLLEKFPYDSSGLKVVDFGAGITPLPVILAQRNANVLTIDNSHMTRRPSEILTANEWGFLDYSALLPGIESINQTFDEHTFKDHDLDVFYSISVVEHMPAKYRRLVFLHLSRALKLGGKAFLSVDLVKNTEDLWYMAAGEIVESSELHGNLKGLVSELEAVGLCIAELEIVRLPDDERVDIALISAVRE